MDKVLIDELEENSLFHFTHQSNIEKISTQGLKPVIGENAFGIEETPKIFFSKGELGIIKVTEVWLRWLMNRIYGPNDRLGIYKNLPQEDKKKNISEWSKEFLSDEYKNDKAKKEKLFEYFYTYLKERRYLVLDIEDQKEYDSNAVDENKVNLKKQDYIYSAFAKIMYGEFSNMETSVMDDWNMHTKANIEVPRKKIKQVTLKDGKDDMLSIVLYLYDKYKNMEHSKFLLDDFVEYAKKKEILKEMINKEGCKDDQNNNSRIY